MDAQIIPISPGNHHSFFDPLNRAVSRSDLRNSVVRCGFAYATLGGVQHLIQELESTKNWHAISKQFLVGIHHGITEPSAISTLQALNNSEVRMFIPGRRVSFAALHVMPLFHPKVVAITLGKSVTFIHAGSANLTSGAIGEVPKNFEISISLSCEQGATADPNGAFESWWRNIWSESRPVNKLLITQYADVRLSVLSTNPILRFSGGTPSGIKNAEYFFAEVGAASGPPESRHQIEFPESLASFFGKPLRQKRELTLRKDAVSWPNRPLSFKRTTFGVEIWRLGMPTQLKGGEPIAERAIRFRRTGNPGIFEFEVADVTSGTFQDWVQLANSRGHLGATHGLRSRQYGFY